MSVTGYSVRPSTAQAAETVPGPATAELSGLARTAGIAIAAGMAERDSADRLFASHLVLYPDGAIERYRKLHIPPPERPLFSPGSEIPLFKLKGLTFGIQLCYDAHFPELSTRMAELGAELILMPHASPRGTPAAKHRSWMRHLPARAYDNSLFVIAFNQTGPNGEELEFPGLALGFDPGGELLAADLGGEERMRVFDLKAETLRHVRSHAMRYFLPNRRPELYGR
jgi:N-carbamoylputrescine amidase